VRSALKSELANGNMKARLKKIWQWSKDLWHRTGLSSPYQNPTTPKIQFVSIADLWEALTRAKKAHGEFERRLGQPDADWPLWFAAYMAAEQGLLGQTCCALVKTTGQVELSQADSEEDYWSRH
jgi:hypothetical protein